VLARPILFRVGPCFGLLFSGRARASPKSPAHIPSTSYRYSLVSFYIFSGVTLGLVDPLTVYCFGSLGNDSKSQTLFILMDSNSSSMTDNHLDKFALLITASYIIGSLSLLISTYKL
jgi:hypothetical protein